MARKSIVDLLSTASSTLPDNTSELITPANVRQMFQDFLDTMAPSYGGLQISSRVQAVTNVPQPIIFMTSVISLPPQWTAIPTTGVLGRALAGVPKLNSRFTICGTIQGPSGADVKIGLYDGNTALAWMQTVSTRGSGNRTPFSFTALDPMEADAVYTLKISGINQTNYTLENVLFVGENVAIRDFATGVDLPRMVAFDTALSSTLDIDQDGKPDTLVSTTTVDSDSTNVDTTGDGVADAVIPKPTPPAPTRGRRR